MHWHVLLLVGCHCDVSVQDVSSIGCYLWDITLLFAQQQEHREVAKLISNLQVCLALVFALLWHKRHRVSVRVCEHLHAHASLPSVSTSATSLSPDQAQSLREICLS